MGAAIAQRLMSLRHGVAVWNRDRTKTQPLAAAGAGGFRSADLSGRLVAVPVRWPTGK